MYLEKFTIQVTHSPDYYESEEAWLAHCPELQFYYWGRTAADAVKGLMQEIEAAE